jgi:hypothetical protein
MKMKKEYLILILIIAALSAYLLMRSADRTHYQLPELSGLKKNEISKIEITQGGKSIILKKMGNRWHIEPAGYLADENKVNAMLNVFENLTLTALVSEAKDYIRYDLHAEKRIGVKAWIGDSLQRSFDIGKAASSFRHTFVRLDGDSRVFHASDNFQSKFDFTVGSLRDKTVLSFKAGDIREMELIRDPAVVKLVRSEVSAEPTVSQTEKADTAPAAAPIKFEWQSSDGQKGNEPNLNRLLTSLGDLKCAEYINDRGKDAFSSPIYTVKLKGARDHRLDIFARLQKDDKNYPAVSSGSDYPFFLTDSQVQQIMINPAEMIKKPESEEKASTPPKPE